MQVDPINPTLKAPGAKRLKVESDKVLSCSAFNFNLRRYVEACGENFVSFRMLGVSCYGIKAGESLRTNALEPHSNRRTQSACLC